MWLQSKLAALQPQSVLRRGTFAGTFLLVVFHYFALSFVFFFSDERMSIDSPSFCFVLSCCVTAGNVFRKPRDLICTISCQSQQFWKRLR